LNQTWGRIKRVLAEHVPELSDSLNIPIDMQELLRIEAELGIMLPPSVRDSYLCVDGQDPSADFKEGIFFGLTLLPLEDVLREWSFWRRVEFDPNTGQNPDILAIMSSIPPGWVKPLYACRGWLPLIADKCGNYVGVDLDPPGNSHAANRADSINGSSSKSRQATGGSWGQVILFGRDFDRKCVLWRGEGEGGWGRWLASFAEELESGAGWEISDRSGGSSSRGDRGNDTDEESEDDIGYSSYYFDAGGATGSSGQGLRLTGEYRGWGVMEAWWDRSVRKWEELGLGIQPEELKRQQEEIDKSNISAPDLMGLGFGGMRIGTAGEDAQVAIPGE
jgi:cell wall assembly regulator SMI1